MKRDRHILPAWRRRLLGWVYPSLRHAPDSDWDALLAEARREPLDRLEWFGTMASLAGVSALLGRLQGAALVSDAFAQHLLTFVLALLGLGLTVAPFWLRGSRRGLARLVARPARSTLLRPEEET